MDARNISVTPSPLSFISDVPLGAAPISHGQLIFRYVFVIVSFAVNLFVIVVVVCSKQLHLPRHTFWAGTSLIITFCTAQWIVELFLDPQRNIAACVIFELSIGSWYPALLLFLSLAGLDRYLAIKHYEWYKRNATNKRAVIVMLITWMLNAFVTNSPYWSGYKVLTNCTANQTHVYLLSIWNVLLGITNITLQIFIFIESRKAIREYYSNTAREGLAIQRFIFRDPQIFNISIELRCYSQNRSREITRHDVRILNATSSNLLENNRQRTEPDLTPSIESNGQVISFNCVPFATHRAGRLDFRAALILSTNVLPFWLFTFPLAIWVMATYLCAQYRLNCSFSLLMEAGVYVKTLFFIPCVYMPMMYVMNSSEFQRALQHLFSKAELRASSANNRSCSQPMN